MADFAIVKTLVTFSSAEAALKHLQAGKVVIVDETITTRNGGTIVARNIRMKFKPDADGPLYKFCFPLPDNAVQQELKDVDSGSVRYIYDTTSVLSESTGEAMRNVVNLVNKELLMHVLKTKVTDEPLKVRMCGVYEGGILRLKTPTVFVKNQPSKEPYDVVAFLVRAGTPRLCFDSYWMLESDGGENDVICGPNITMSATKFLTDEQKQERAVILKRSRVTLGKSELDERKSKIAHV